MIQTKPTIRTALIPTPPVLPRIMPKVGDKVFAMRTNTLNFWVPRSEEHTSELQSRRDLVCRLLLEKKKKKPITHADCTRLKMAAIAIICLLFTRYCRLRLT